jgi:L-fuconolactonase
MSTGPVLDSHHHLWDLSVRGQPWLASEAALAPLRRNFTAADLAPLAAAAGVTASIVVQTVTEPGETREMLEIASGPSLGAPYGDVVGAARALTSDLSQPEQDAIFGGTARRVYQIGDLR